ncbi:MAG: hypothetical protein KKD48_03380 [Nanoarchaeota archaeon]|nr:hypothetical protein [Nanoarchaeota archaeon]
MKSLDILEERFKDMVKTGKVDTSVINNLNEFKDYLNDYKKPQERTNLLKKFSVLHAIETQIRIINHMIWRVGNAQKIGDNPKVADDAISIFSNLNLVNDNLTNEDSNFLLELTSELQVSAMKNGMYPSSKEVIKSVNKKNIKNDFNRFMNNMVEEVEKV